MQTKREYDMSDATSGKHSSPVTVIGLGLMGSTLAAAFLDAGQEWDARFLGRMWGTLNGFLHALALVGTEGIVARTFLPFATDWLAGVGSFLPGIASQVDDGTYSADEATLEVERGAAAGPAVGAGLTPTS